MNKREPKDNNEHKETAHKETAHKEAAHKEHKSRTKKEHEHLDLVSDPFTDEDVTSESLKAATKAVGATTDVAMLQKELDEAKDRTLRARAELENYRARVNRLMEDERKYASIELMRDLLPIWDNLNRAIDAAEKTKIDGNAQSDDFESFIQGVRLVQEQLLVVLGKHHCEKIEALHQPFDPNFHESIAKFPDPNHEPNTVINEALPGFKLHDRIVRPSQVVLSAGK
ncbi:MAG: nucleotide exchange factor GrpE [Thermoguttaceae bacterium]